MKKQPYAAETKVPVLKTKQEIEELLIKYGATSFVQGTMPMKATIMFEIGGRRVRFDLPLPTDRNAERAAKLHRQKWRALYISIKAKLVTVDAGIETFEEAFLAHVVQADGTTVYEGVQQALIHQYETGRMLPLLPGPST